MTEIDKKNLNIWHKLYERWIISAKKIKNDNTLADGVNISEEIDIEKEIWSCALEFKNNGIELPESMAKFKSYTKSYKEIYKELASENSSTESESIDETGKKITRPVNPEIATQRQNLHIRYYELREKSEFKKNKCLEILHSEFPQWTVSTIETYLKK